MMSMKAVQKETDPRCMARMTLRLSPEMLSVIDDDRASRPGSISRNTWIIEAIAEKLARRGKATPIQVDKASNG